MDNVFAVYDSKGAYYLKPFMVRSRGEAIRMFSDEVNRPDSMMGTHPEDFTLFYLGMFDELTGKYKNANAPESLGVALEYKAKEDNKIKFVPSETK